MTLEMYDLVEFKEYYHKRLGTEVNHTLPQNLHEQSHFELLKDIVTKISKKELMVSNQVVCFLNSEIDKINLVI